MRSSRRKLLSASVFLAFAIAVGCTGFFVNPTLSTLAIGPQTPTLTSNPVQTLQMSATGTFSDGSTQDLTGKVLWNSATPNCAAIAKGGLVTPATTVAGGICTTQVTASFSTATPATTTVTVTAGTPTSITLTASSTTPTAASSVTFKAVATFPNSSGQQDITTSVTWNNSDTTDLTLTQGSGSGTISGGVAVGTQINVQATFDGVNSNVVTLTIAP